MRVAVGLEAISGTDRMAPHMREAIVRMSSLSMKLPPMLSRSSGCKVVVFPEGMLGVAQPHKNKASNSEAQNSLVATGLTGDG